MVLHPDTLTAILNNWDAPKYDGSQDVRPWLKAIEELCRIYGIPRIQMTEMAVRCTAGRANPVLSAMFEAQVTEVGVWFWEDFKHCVIQIEDNYRQKIRDAPHDTHDGDFRTEHPYTTAALAVTLIGVGSAVLLPAITVGLLGIIGLGPGGLAAGGLVACLQSVLCGSATMAPPLFATFAGFGTAAAGTWLGFTSSIAEDLPDADS